MAAVGESALVLQFKRSLDVVELQRRVLSMAVLVDSNQYLLGSQGSIAVHDASTHVRQAAVAIPCNHSVELLHVLPDQNRVVAVCSEWVVYVLALSTMRVAGLMDLSSVKKKGLSNPLCCVLPGKPGSRDTASSAPVVLVTSALKDSVRSAYMPASREALQDSSVEASRGSKDGAKKGSAKEGSKGAAKDMMPGHKLTLTQEKGKGVVAMAAHPFVSMLFTLTANGELHAFTHAPGTGLQVVTTFTMLLEESKGPTRQVSGAHLSTAPCPRHATATLVFIFLPAIHLLYIMSHVPGEPLKPFQRVPWLGCDHVVSVDVSQRHNMIAAIAGLSRRGRALCRYSLRAWTVVGADGAPVENLRLVARDVSPRVSEPLGDDAGAVVHDQPEWATLWNGRARAGTAIKSQAGHLDLLSVAGGRGAAPAFFARRAAFLPLSSTFLIQYSAFQNAPPGPVPALGAFQLLNLGHPTHEHPSAIVGPVHTPALQWHVDDDGVLVLPHAFPYLQSNRVRLFATAPQDARTLQELPVEDDDGLAVEPDLLTHSALQHAALVFGAVVGDGGTRKFVYVDVSGRPLEADEEQAPSWLPGVMGAFVGPADASFAVLESAALGGDNIAVYNARSPFDAPELMFYSYLERGVGDSVVGLWPAPPSTTMLTEAAYDENGNLIGQDESEPTGEGLVLLATRSRGLLLALLPAAADALSAADSGEDLLPVTPQFEMQLLPKEVVCQVGWTYLVPREQVGYPNQCLGAILTTHRIIIVDGQLTLLQSLALTGGQAPSSTPHATTSLLWVGPALLLAQSSGRIEQVLLTGKRLHVCSVSTDGLYVLAAATADCLTFVQRRGDVAVVTARKLYVAPLLVKAWLSMLLTQHSYGTWPNVRLELQRLVRSFNIHVALDVPTIELLLASGCGDLLAKGGGGDALVAGAKVSRVATAAASNDWDFAAAQALAAFHASPYAPSAPPPGSHMRQVLAAVALGAMSQGKWKCAERCLAAAGETLLQLLVVALQHDRPSLHQAAVPSAGRSTGNVTLAALLLAADARIGLRQQLQKDWLITRPVQDKDASTWEQSSNPQPPMLARADRSQRVDVSPRSGEEGPIPPLWSGGLPAHLGLTFNQILETAPVLPAGATPARAPKATGDAEEAEAEPEPTSEELAARQARDKFLENFEGDSLFGSGPLDGEGERADGGDLLGGLIDVGDGDAGEGEEEEEDIPEDAAALEAHNIRKATARRARAQPAGDAADAGRGVALGPPGAVPLGAAAAAKGGVVTDDAWQDLGLPNPAPVPAPGPAEEGGGDDFDPFAAFSDLAIPDETADAAAGQDSAPTEASPSSAQETAGAPVAPDADALPGTSNSAASPLPEANGGAPAPTAPDSSAPVIPRGPERVPDSSNVPGFTEGISAMLAGQWAQAAAALSHAFSVCADAASRQQIAQYAAVVGLLQIAAAAHPVEAARLYRYVSAMTLLHLDHLSILVNHSVTRNLDAGNAKWCTARMVAFVEGCRAIGRGDLATGASGLLQQCKLAGDSDATVPPAESLGAFVARVSASSSVYEVGEHIAALSTVPH